jgi:hypothetical protein
MLIKEKDKLRLDALVRGKITPINAVDKISEDLSVVQF